MVKGDDSRGCVYAGVPCCFLKYKGTEYSVVPSAECRVQRLYSIRSIVLCMLWYSVALRRALRDCLLIITEAFPVLNNDV